MRVVVVDKELKGSTTEGATMGCNCRTEPGLCKEKEQKKSNEFDSELTWVGILELSLINSGIRMHNGLLKRQTAFRLSPISRPMSLTVKVHIVWPPFCVLRESHYNKLAVLGRAVCASTGWRRPEGGEAVPHKEAFSFFRGARVLAGLHGEAPTTRAPEAVAWKLGKPYSNDSITGFARHPGTATQSRTVSASWGPARESKSGGFTCCPGSEG